ncbi:MAG: zinc ribbon domain-containing protein [Oscillospiraceae bacterium]|nr:zinc ribbon domain-containing protein [Oscillospiraceae bacterium]
MTSNLDFFKSIMEEYGEDWVCPRCGTTNKSSNRGCVECGLPKGSWRCPRCNKGNPPDARYCMKCDNPKPNYRR